MYVCKQKCTCYTIPSHILLNLTSQTQYNSQDTLSISNFNNLATP